ncbi:unnamed protein product [Vitrella brassicaformis CCMP3155]|uniref:Uncharacterized protein n=1 Tax=Vitrella brassicaformis (strain CCMP3155) TaxID=1169540 RepID=A0A0G4EF99_VITBC|nr:unnamed protein product [Vitrella brassicaformis CCMP3155]|eukprot:CEL94087.1 unnamed protein product [Vitrella brassicaformis CCMP3155]
MPLDSSNERNHWIAFFEFHSHHRLFERAPNTNLHEEDRCQWSEWQTVTKCSVTCGPGGYFLQKRTLWSAPTHNPESCGSPVREVPCANSKECAVDCQLSEWTNIVPCTAACLTAEGREAKHGIKAFRIDIRTIEVPPMGDGLSCEEHPDLQKGTGNAYWDEEDNVAKRRLPCDPEHIKPCEYQCRYTDWQRYDARYYPWGDGMCPYPCGGIGRITRIRQVIPVWPRQSDSQLGEQCPPAKEILHEEPCGVDTCPDCAIYLEGEAQTGKTTSVWVWVTLVQQAHKLEIYAPPGFDFGLGNRTCSWTGKSFGKISKCEVLGERGNQEGPANSVHISLYDYIRPHNNSETVVPEWIKFRFLTPPIPPEHGDWRVTTYSLDRKQETFICEAPQEIKTPMECSWVNVLVEPEECSRCDEEVDLKVRVQHVFKENDYCTLTAQEIEDYGRLTEYRTVSCHDVCPPIPLASHPHTSFQQTDDVSSDGPITTETADSGEDIGTISVTGPLDVHPVRGDPKLSFTLQGDRRWEMLLDRTVGPAPLVLRYVPLNLDQISAGPNYLTILQPTYFSQHLSVKGLTRYGASISVAGTVDVAARTRFFGDFSVGNEALFGNDVNVRGSLSVASTTFLGNALSVSTSTSIGSGLSVFGGSVANGALSAIDRVDFGSSLSVRSFTRLGFSMSLSGTSRFGGSLSAFDFVSFGSSLSVRDFVSLGSDLSVQGDVTFSSMSVFDQTALGGLLAIGSTLSVRSFVRLGSSLSVHNVARLGASLSAFDHVMLGSSLSLRDMATIGSSPSVRSLTYVGDRLSVHKNGVISGGLAVDGPLQLGSSLSIESRFDLASSLSVGGLTSLGSQVTIFDATLLGSSLSVGGFVELGSSFSLASVARLGSSLSLHNVARLGASLSVFDHVILGSSLSLRDMATIGSSLSVMSFAHLGSTLSVSGDAVLSGLLSVSDRSSLASSLSVGGPTELRSQLTVHHNASILGSLSLSSAVYLDKSVSLLWDSSTATDPQVALVYDNTLRITFRVYNSTATALVDVLQVTPYGGAFLGSWDLPVLYTLSINQWLRVGSTLSVDGSSVFLGPISVQPSKLSHVGRLRGQSEAVMESSLSVKGYTALGGTQPALSIKDYSSADITSANKAGGLLAGDWLLGDGVSTNGSFTVTMGTNLDVLAGATLNVHTGGTWNITGRTIQAGDVDTINVIGVASIAALSP